jgi:hypothetical protein
MTPEIQHLIFCAAFPNWADKIETMGLNMFLVYVILVCWVVAYACVLARELGSPK